MKKDKIIKIILILIIVLQVILKLYIDSKKEDFNIDELYSYGLMNYKQAFIFEEETFMNNWHSKEYFDEYLVISENEKSDFSPVYNNQMEDFHPPFYYLLLRISASITIGSFSKWTGLILNIIIYIIAATIVYLIGKKIFKNKIYALILVFAYGFSKFSTENTLFIRMYQLLELEMLILTYWSVKKYYKKDLQIKDLISLLTIIVVGTLTHYYFIIYLLGISIEILIRYTRRKQFKNALKYIAIFIIAQIIICMIFPKYKDQLSGNTERSNEITTTQTSKLEYIEQRENQYFEILNNNMFHFEIKYLYAIMIIVGVVLLTIKIIKHGKEKVKIRPHKRINTIIVPTIFYWLLVTITSPYIDIRYILPIFIFILIITMYLLKREIKIAVKDKKAVLAITMTTMMLCTVLFWKNTGFEYHYAENKLKIEELREYKDIPCIYMYAHKNVLYNSFVNNLNYVRQFENVYIMDKTMFTINKLKKALEDVDTSKGIIIFEDRSEMNDKINLITQNIEGFSNYRSLGNFDKGTMKSVQIYYLY